MRLLLIRHAQTAWNAGGRAQGHTDIDLDEIGLRQVEQLVYATRFLEIGVVFTSDLKRSVETAKPVALAHGATLHVRSELRERSFGDWEGHDYACIRQRLEATHAQPEHRCAPGGESTFALWQRLEALESELRTLDMNSAVVTHGGTCGLLLSRLLRGTIETARSFSFGNTSITELERRSDGLMVLRRIGDISHLEGGGVAMTDANHPAHS